MDEEEWEFDDEMVDELLAGAETAERGSASFRATIREGRIWLRAWHPDLFPMGPEDTKRRPVAENVALVDLTVPETGGDRRDLIARFIYRSRTADDEGSLIDWATRTGYSMLWLPDRLVSLEIDPNRLGEASTDCLTCGASWTCGDPGFWAAVLARGFFPDTCCYCGCALPEWTS